MRVVLIGPLPPPVNGCSYANDVLLRAPTGLCFLTIDTNTAGISGQQGSRFSVRKSLLFLRTYFELPKLLFTDVIYLTPGQTFFGLMKYAPFIGLAILLRKPYVIHVHGNHLGSHYAGLVGLKRRVFHYFISKASAGVVLSRSLRANFSGLLPESKVVVVGNFAGDDLIGERPPKKSKDGLRILYLSNLMREKGIIELLDAFSILQSRGVPFTAVIAGEMEFGIEDEVRYRLKGLGDTVAYVGRLDGEEKRDALLNSNIFILPTYYVMEGQPISLLEGLATGNIIITTDHAGIPDVIGDEHGYVVPVRDACAIADAVSHIAADLPSNLARFSASNARYAAESFSQRSFSEGIASVLRQQSKGGQ